MIKRNYLLKLLIIINSILLYRISYYEYTTFNTTSLNKKDNYYMKIDIPSIKLSKYLFPIKHKDNNINKNIIILEKSNEPDVINGNLILAAHSGNSNKSFFKYLNNIKRKDSIIISFNNKNYIYEYSNKYSINKTGKAEIMRDNNKTTLTMITCDRADKTKQIVFIAYLKEVKNVEN